MGAPEIVGMSLAIPLGLPSSDPNCDEFENEPDCQGITPDCEGLAFKLGGAGMLTLGSGKLRRGSGRFQSPGDSGAKPEKSLGAGVTGMGTMGSAGVEKSGFG
jgi:hypothetical protein